MRMLSPNSEADVYAITCQLGLTKIGFRFISRVAEGRRVAPS